ncbi:glycine--tRNA ligase subunit beta [Xylella taiwanensis]|uniref:Glycine--tRNA ligase beta subunit n=1 Tax=Xylella taiwanensis TaxID=1444770 RepID=Z9JIU9_9GAMM|nr:glycine--tRNA ligase subunit beta [Xylella taiwanensis]AXI83629.1 glycyl-tRNA synthetase subunit beta [Xylella taiwanensis]EWS77761.1 glycyl-tRNA synthetase subunit beta [Xylella taiwanensis]MCD8456713.1 glycine--tRNA ligase subunit beta [Xylella taiwanensis]MCD8459120.1 glycine--tRNA ligase subunit beta [Xylella taiwanensis]MCD8461986.1 glycine--tRNA ligase subunit beta [Xylella taiwanensis]
MTELKPLLIELGTEELPINALPGLSQAFFEGVLTGLEKRGIVIDHGDAKSLSTPRRLAVLLTAVAAEQPEQYRELFGPYLNVAFDDAGKPTKALEGFAAKCGVNWTALERIRDAKGERFVHRVVVPGERTHTLLPEILTEAIVSMPIPKPMRWGAHNYLFARPVHWLVVLFGQDVVEAEVMGVKADRISRGHRFLHGKPVWLSDPQDYIDVLQAAYVLVDPAARRARIVAEIEAAARQAGGVARITADNLEQVVNLVEWPSAVLCSFERVFLEVPQEALIETMEVNQRFFPVLDGLGKLTEKFIGIANIKSNDVAEVAKGYERVIRPRFSDAKFFFDEDLKQGLKAMGEGLRTVTYQAKLGTLADKVARVLVLAEAIAPQVGVDPMLARRAALLSKNDLQSRMVNEFPELQGIAGHHYALVSGELPEVAMAIEDAYRPRFAGDDIARSPLGKVLALAERLDTLACGFAVGLKPTGNKDPFALRRNALGLARTMIESRFDLDLKVLLDQASDWAAFATTIEQERHAHGSEKEAAVTHSVPQASDEKSVRIEELYDFIVERLRGYYADRGIPATHFNAVAERKPVSLYDFHRRIDAIGRFAALPEAEALAVANKRIRNILRKAEIKIPDSVDSVFLLEPAERVLVVALEGVISDTRSALDCKNYVSVLTCLARLRPHIDEFFDKVMVNDADLKLRANRLALLQRLGEHLGCVAAIEHLSS